MNDIKGYLFGSISGIFQNSVTYPLDTLKTRLQNKHIINTNFFAGIKESTVSTVLTTSIGFGTNELVKKYVDSEYKSGFIAGMVNSIICTPLETIKIKKQLNIKPNYNNLFVGFKPTFCRETIGNSIYFGTYQKLISKTEKTKFDIMMIGGISGSLSWLFTFPIDVIKTRVQSGMTYKDAINAGKFRNGLGYCLLRSFIGNGLGFLVYEHLNENFSLI